MPELPEIETIRRDLEKTLVGDKSLSVNVFDTRLMSKQTARQWGQTLEGQTWQHFGRKGKYLWATLSNGHRAFFHMRMTGQLIVHEQDSSEKSRMMIHFASGRSLGLHDQRRFAEAWLVAPSDVWREHNPLGPDALDELKENDFVRLVRSKTTSIQPLLMDQRYIAGVGNIYAQEALFKAGIRPTRAGKRISKCEAVKLFIALQETLRNAIDNRGSTSRNYRDAYGGEGSAQKFHGVYRKGGKPCVRCKTILKTIRVGGRGSVFCLTCQK